MIWGVSPIIFRNTHIYFWGGRPDLGLIPRFSSSFPNSFSRWYEGNQAVAVSVMAMMALVVEWWLRIFCFYFQLCLFLAPSTCKGAFSCPFFRTMNFLEPLVLLHFFNVFALRVHGWFMQTVQMYCACHTKPFSCWNHLTVVLKVLRNGLLRYILYTCPNL